MAPIPDAQTAAQRWAQGLAASSQKITEGVQAVTRAPGQAAVANAQRYINGIMESFNNGVWQRRTAAVTLEDWRQQMLSKGVQRVAQGAQASQLQWGPGL